MHLCKPILGQDKVHYQYGLCKSNALVLDYKKSFERCLVVYTFTLYLCKPILGQDRVRRFFVSCATNQGGTSRNKKINIAHFVVHFYILYAYQNVHIIPFLLKYLPIQTRALITPVY